MTRPGNAHHQEQSQPDRAPMRRCGSFLPGSGVGAAGCTGTARPSAPAQRLRGGEPQSGALRQPPRRHDHPGFTAYYRLAGAAFRPLQKLSGIAGKAGNLNAGSRRRQPVRGLAQRLYPNPPMAMTSTGPLQGCAQAHGTEPFSGPSANIAGLHHRSACSSHPAPIAASARSSAAATIQGEPAYDILPVTCATPTSPSNPERGPCTSPSKAPATRATGVRHIDMHGDEFDQPARSSSLSLPYPEHPLMSSRHRRDLRSATARATSAKLLHQVDSSVDDIYDDHQHQRVRRCRRPRKVVDEYTVDNFDQSGLDSSAAAISPPGPPRPADRGPPHAGGHARGGGRGKGPWPKLPEIHLELDHGAPWPTTPNFSLDPTYTDVYGRPSCGSPTIHPQRPRMTTSSPPRAAELGARMACARSR